MDFHFHYDPNDPDNQIRHIEWLRSSDVGKLLIDVQLNRAFRLMDEQEEYLDDLYYSEEQKNYFSDYEDQMKEFYAANPRPRSYLRLQKKRDGEETAPVQRRTREK